MKTTPSGFHIGRSDQLRALASPLRQEIVDSLESAGPCSIAALAEHLSRPADALYFHVRHLLRCGLVIEVERKLEGRHAFSVYDVVGRPLRIDRARARSNDLGRVARGILRLAERDYQRGFDDPSAQGSGAHRNHWVARALGWLDEAEIVEINRRLESVLELLRAGRPGKGRRAVAVSFALTPPTPRRASTQRPVRDPTGSRVPRVKVGAQESIRARSPRPSKPATKLRSKARSTPRPGSGRRRGRGGSQ